MFTEHGARTLHGYPVNPPNSPPGGTRPPVSEQTAAGRGGTGFVEGLLSRGGLVPPLPFAHTQCGAQWEGQHTP